MGYNKPMAIGWGMRRKALYITVAGAAALVLGVAIWRIFFVAVPQCFDGVQNGAEHGVDCGGACALICAHEAAAPVVLWSRSFETAPSTYTAVAYIQNKNVGAVARNVRYTFQIFDDKNLLVVERTGTTTIPPALTVPIVESNINVGNRTVARTLFAFADVPVWKKVEVELPLLRTTNQSLARDGSRLSATIVNESLIDARKVAAVAVLFDAAGVAKDASRSIVDIPRKGSKEVVFTWSSGVPGIVRAELTVLPSL